MAKSEDFYTAPAQSVTSFLSAFTRIAIAFITQHVRLRESSPDKFAARSGYPPHFSVPVRHRNDRVVQSGKIVLQPRVLAGLVTAVGIFVGSFWLTLLVV